MTLADATRPSAAHESSQDHPLLALTAAQLGIWNAQRLEPDSPYYVVGDVVEITGDQPVDIEALIEAIGRTRAEADSLRLRVELTAEGPMQRIDDAKDVDIPVVDVRCEPDPRAAAERAVADERTRLAAACLAMVDRDLFAYLIIRLSDTDVWYTQMGHHLVFDGYSAAMLSRRVAAHYGALVSGVPPAKNPFGSFAEFVATDLAYRDGEQIDDDRAYWRDRLTPLPPYPAHADAGGFAGATRSAGAELPASTFEAVQRTADEAGTTWGETLIACYAAFLHRALGETDVVFAMPLMCRTGAVQLRTPAMAVNVLPLRIAVHAGDNLLVLSERVADAMREMRKHQRYRGEDLPRDLSAPGVGSVLHGRGINLKAFDLALRFGTSSAVMRNVAGGPPEDYGLSVIPTAGGGLLIGFEVGEWAATAEQVNGRLDAVSTLITALTEPGHPAVGQVDLLDSATRADLIRRSRTEPTEHVDIDIAWSLRSLARTDGPALVDGANRMSWRELAAAVHRTARFLRVRGIGAEDVVAVSLPRSTDLVVLLLAVWEAGAAYQYLDPTHPEARHAELVADSRPALLVTEADATMLGRSGVEQLALDDPTREAIAAQSAAPLVDAELSAPRHPDHLAYIIHTSGSTGRPKGVAARYGGLNSLLRHHRRTLVEVAAARAEELGRSGPLRCAHTYSFSFDASLDQLLWLLGGHTLHLYSTEIARDAEALLTAFRSDGIDVVDTTPSMAAPLIEAGLLDGKHPPSLLVLGGEATGNALWQRISASEVPAVNLYGPTEAAVDATAATVAGDVATIGTAVPGTAAYVLDTALAPVIDGEVGELYLAGPHLARGYLKLPAATAERFVADPFGRTGTRMYRTGDRVRRLGAGGYQYLGRGDGQIKLRGFRIELAEVEAALAAVREVTAAAAMIRGEGGRDRLVGYVTGAITAERVRERLSERVPEHLVPSAVIVLDEMPVTVNGKLDRAALPAPTVGAHGRDPQTEPERTLCAVVAAVFDLPTVSPDDDFFSLGGDSISAITVCSDLRARGLSLRPRDFLAGGSFAALAASAAATQNEPPAAPAVSATGDAAAPPIVAALLGAHDDIGRIAGYAQWVAPELPDGAAPLALTELLTAIVAAHPALRLRVRGRRTLTFADTAPPVEVGESECIAGAPDDGVDAVARRLSETLDPETGAVLRAELIRTPGGRADRLVLVIHHLSVDGISWRVLLTDLADAYRGHAKGEDIAIARETTSWRAHASELAEQGRSGSRAGELEYFRTALGDAARIGARALDPARDLSGTARVSVTRTDSATAEYVARDLPSTYRAGTDDALLSVLTLALRLWRRTSASATATELGDAATVTLEGHGREDVVADGDLARTVGWFTTEFPVRLPLDEIRADAALDEALAGGPAAGRLLRAVKEAKRAIPDHGIGFGVLKHLDPDTAADLAGPVPDIVFNYLGRFDDGGGAWKLPGDTPFAVLEPAGKALEQVLAVNCFDTAGGLTVEWTAAALAIDADTVAELQECWQTAMRAMAAHARGVRHVDAGLTPSDVPLVAVDQPDIDLLETAGPIAAILPATNLQVGLAFHSQVLADGEPDAYVVQAATYLRGAVDEQRMADAAAELLRRVPTLRGYLGSTASAGVVQVIPVQTRPDFRFVDVAGEADPDSAFDAVARAERERRFDPGASPLIRFLLCRVGTDRYRLALTNHHALLDGWSMPIAGRTLFAIYAELGGGPQAPASPPLDAYYRWRTQQDASAAHRAWSEELKGVEAGTLLAPAASGASAAAPEQIHVRLDAALTEALGALTRSQGVTLTSVLHAAWGLLLGRLTGRRDVVFGCPVSGRPDEVDGIGAMVGQLGEAIAVRVRSHPTQAVGDLLRDVHRRGLAVSDHHHLGLMEITRAAGVGELFDTIVVTENFPTSDRRVQLIEPGLELTGVDITDATHYPLTIVALPGEQLTLGLGYRPDLLPENTVRSYTRWLREVLSAFAADPDAPVGSIGTLDAAERETMLELGDVPARGDYGPLLVEFGKHVDTNPDHLAVVCEGRSMTYAELDLAANRVANQLLEHGVAPQDRVAVFAERDVPWYVAIFAVLKAGAVYLPLDPTYPAARLEFLLQDAAPTAALTCGSIPAEATGVVADHIPVLAVELADQTGDDSDPAHARRTVTSDSLAYVIYTSGTTGVPKGVAVAHRGLPDLMAFVIEGLGFTPEDRVLQVGSPSFDISILQVLGPLMAGGTSVIAPDAVRVPGDELIDYLHRHGVTVVNFLPSFLAAMPDDARVDPSVVFMVGAERLDPELADRWGRDRRGLFNCYGPTEATINAVLWRYRPNDPGPLPIGRPDPNLPCYVLDEGLNPVGTGVVGELYLAGDALAQGYVNRPDLTATAFVANPFGPPGSRMYRTGDLVAWRADGNLTFHGRADHQVKIRGLRVELGEIETELARRAGVRAATVLVRDGRLVGYLVRSDDAAPDPDAIRGELLDVLPPHLVPTSYVVLDRLPLGPTGKLDRDALPTPEVARSAAGDDRAPDTDAEVAMLEVFRELLDRADVRLGDDFVELGGDSLMSLQVVSRARRRGLLLGPRDVLQGRTVAGIAGRARTTPESDAPGGSDFDQFLAVLTLSEADQPDTFIGRHPAKVGVHTFGGQILAQAIVAAGATVGTSSADPSTGPLPLHAAHTHFVELGSVTEDLTYRVLRLRDGQTTANRQVTVEQGDHVVAVMTLAYQAPQARALTHADPAPRVGSPESATPIRDSLAGREDALRALVEASHPIDIRFASAPVWERRDNDDSPSGTAVWMRADGDLPDDPVLHAAALAWASDITVQDPIIARHGLSWGYDPVNAASLNQSLWFHRPTRFDRFHLFATDSPVAGDGRGLSTGHFYCDGELVATVTQEAAVRLLRD